MLAAGIAVIQVTGIAQVQCTVIESRSQLSTLLAIALSHLIIHLEQLARLGRGGNHQVTHVLRQTVDEELRVKAPIAYFLIYQQGLVHVSGKETIHKPEVVVIVQHIEVVKSALIGDMPLGRGGYLVKDREGVAHGAVGLLGNDVERGRLGIDMFLFTHILQLLHNIGHGDAGEIINLAAGQDGGDDLLLLGSGKDEDSVCGRLFQRLEESIKGRLGKHVDLIDDEDAVTASLRRDAHLLGQVADVVHTVVGCGIQLIDVVGTLLVERLA